VRKHQSTTRDLWFLLASGLVLTYAAFNHGGVTPVEWSRCLIALGGVLALFWLSVGARQAEPVNPWLLRLPIVVVAYTALQLVPLPPQMLSRLSPAREQIAAALTRIDASHSWNPLSVSPYLTFSHLLRLLAYLLVFLSLRELTGRLRERPWITLVPLVAIASLEAALGLWQSLAGAGRATGTYANANHLAGLLEMSLPLALGLTVKAVRMRNVLSIILAAACSVLIFASLLYTASRTGFAAAMIAIVCFGGLLALRRGKAFVALAILAVFIAILFLGVPNQLLDRLAETNGPDVSPDVRFQIWRETLRLIRAYPVFGCGLGTYVSAIQQYRISSTPLALVDYAHNDYLQFLAEWGVAGFAPAVGFAVLLLWRALRQATSGGRRDQRLLPAACFAGLLALAIHSFADFNLYIPVNAMVAAWIAGTIAGISAGVSLRIDGSASPRSGSSRSPVPSVEPPVRSSFANRRPLKPV
jgi:O-antigen ligase